MQLDTADAYARSPRSALKVRTGCARILGFAGPLRRLAAEGRARSRRNSRPARERFSEVSGPGRLNVMAATIAEYRPWPSRPAVTLEMCT
jgi:hypothetical protein